MPGTVIPNRFYHHPVTGQRVGLHTSHVPAGCELVTEGFTIRHPDGTTGLGRGAFDTAEEAQAWVDAHPRFPGMSQH